MSWSGKYVSATVQRITFTATKVGIYGFVDNSATIGGAVYMRGWDSLEPRKQHGTLDVADSDFGTPAGGDDNTPDDVVWYWFREVDGRTQHGAESFGLIDNETECIGPDC